MSVTSTTVKDQFNGDGVTTKFNYDFNVLIDPNSALSALVLPISILVYFTVAGVTTLQSAATYTSYGPGDVTNPSSIIFGIAPPSGTVVTIYRKKDLTQLSRFRPQQPMDASVMEESWDLLTMICQQIQEEIGRSVLEDISYIGPQINFPPPLANMYIRWDPTGIFLINDPGPVVGAATPLTFPYRVVFDVNDPVTLGFAPSHYTGYTGTTWNVGDRSFNTTPIPGGYDGWVCTSAGTSVTAVFKPIGQVST